MGVRRDVMPRSYSPGLVLQKLSLWHVSHIPSRNVLTICSHGGHSGDGRSHSSAVWGEAKLNRCKLDPRALLPIWGCRQPLRCYWLASLRRLCFRQARLNAVEVPLSVRDGRQSSHRSRGAATFRSTAPPSESGPGNRHKPHHLGCSRSSRCPRASAPLSPAHG